MDSARHSGTVAYFSMEIALSPELPTYSGGLGILAGDTLRSAADLGLDMVGVTLLHRKGYLRQHLDAAGNQRESDIQWEPESLLTLCSEQAAVELEGRRVELRIWRYDVRGTGDHVVPVFLLDSSLPQNHASDRAFTDHLYGGDQRYRLCQEVLLGIGGVAALRALGVGSVARYHINEGHASLLTVALLEQQLAERSGWEVEEQDMDSVRRRCIFTTHTPVPAGHDRFPVPLAKSVMGEPRFRLLESALADVQAELNMTHVALRLARHVNAVSHRHAEVSRLMFPGHRIDAITNGVHAPTWVARPMQGVLDRFLPGWRSDNASLRAAVAIPAEEIVAAHAAARQRMLDEVELRTGIRLSDEAFTIGFARRATPYKRAELILADAARLAEMAERHLPLQLVFAGKAHPHDEPGKEIIRRIHRAASKAGEGVRIVYLENYDMRLAQFLVSGVDLWLNTPERPLEASGTSGMKAALNGVPSLSVLDGWWIEGHVEGVTGWSIGDSADESGTEQDAAAMYDKLEREILPRFAAGSSEWGGIMRSCIALNGSFFNTERMVRQYAKRAYGMDVAEPGIPAASSDRVG